MEVSGDQGSKGVVTFLSVEPSRLGPERREEKGDRGREGCSPGTRGKKGPGLTSQGDMVSSGGYDRARAIPVKCYADAACRLCKDRATLCNAELGFLNRDAG